MPPLSLPLRRRPKVSVWINVVMVAVISLGFLWVVSQLQLPQQGHIQHQVQQLQQAKPKVTEPWNPFAKIKPSTQLQWHPCVGDETGKQPQLEIKDLLCARLTVPLNYHRDQTQQSKSGIFSPQNRNGEEGEVHIALMLLPAKNMTAALASAKSPLLINPGGPGGSGNLLQLILGHAIQTIFGDDDQPILGFDPRGVAFTTPKADCWTPPPPAECTNSGTSSGTGTGTTGGERNGEEKCLPDYLRGLSHRHEWEMHVEDIGLINSSNVALSFLDANFRAANDLCRVKHDSLASSSGGASILSHASTAHVAQDMLSIVDAWDEWVDREAASRGIKSALVTANPTRGKLVYWGFSYGSYLGSVFASMFPDRVGRLLLDGVVDAEEYASDVWTNSIRDADHIWSRFFDYCVEAGPSCALYRHDDTPASIRQRYEAILSQLDEQPVTFIHPEYFVPHLIRSENLRRLIFSLLYFPVQGFPGLAMILNWLHERNYAPFAQLLVGDQLPLCALPSTFDIMITDASRAVMCADKKKPVNLTLAQLRAKYETMAELSKDFADVWFQVMLQCNGWNISQPHDTNLDTHANSDTKTSPVTTSFPILFLSNTYDPVTPLSAAVKMALRFRDAGLVEQKTEGHSTLASVSRCIAKIVRDYVVHGKVLPAPEITSRGDGDYLKGTWTTCEADDKPWGDTNIAIAEEDREVIRAMEVLRDAMVAMPRWGMGGTNTNMRSVQKVLKMASQQGSWERGDL